MRRPARSRRTIIAPHRRRYRDEFRELVAARELLWFLVWRDVKVRYKQSAFGVAWAVLQPIGLMIVFAVFLGRLARVPSDGLPYAVFVLTGLTAWTFLAQAVNAASTSLVDNAQILTKVYFPRLALPLAAIGAHAFDLLITGAVLLGFAAARGYPPTSRWTLVPVLLGFVALVGVGVGVGLAALVARYRDVKHALPFLLQLWFFLTPVVYPASLVKGSARLIFSLNPVVGVVEGLRWAVLGSGDFPVSLVTGALVTGGVLGVSIRYFARTEQTLADVI